MRPRLAIVALALGLLPLQAKAAEPEAETEAAQTLQPVAPLRPVLERSDDPFTALLSLSEAKAALDAGRHADAAQLYADIHTGAPELADAAIGLGRARLRLGDFRGAADAFAKGGDRTGWQIARAHLGEVSEADLRAQYALDPDPRLMIALGQMLDRAGDHNGARKVFGSTPGLRPGLAANNIGQSFLAEGRLEAARLAFAEAAKLDPDDARFRNNLRLTQLAAGDYVDGLIGLRGDEAASLLGAAAAGAITRGETRLAEIFLSRAEAASPVYDPRLATLRKRLESQQDMEAR